jgi:hypothetical protein
MLVCAHLREAGVGPGCTSRRKAARSGFKWDPGLPRPDARAPPAGGPSSLTNEGGKCHF